MPSSHLILGHPFLLLPPISLSIRVFSNESTLHMRCPRYWSFSFSIIPSKEIPGLISFRMDSLDLLAVQGPSRVFSNTTVQTHQFFSAQPSSQSNSHIQKMKIMASSPITPWEIDGETVETVSDFILGGSKSLKIVTAAMKLKHAYSLEEKL